MTQQIILANLQSMQQQLDYLVHKHLSPLDIRRHHIAQAMERLDIQNPNTHPDSEDLDDEHTARYEDSYQIQMLTEAILETPTDPTLWMQRGHVWKRMGNTGIAISDFIRACQQWLNHPERLSHPLMESSDIHDTFKNIESLSPQMANQLLQRFPKLTTLLQNAHQNP
jgi:hypothetical protein